MQVLLAGFHKTNHKLLDSFCNQYVLLIRCIFHLAPVFGSAAFFVKGGQTMMVMIVSLIQIYNVGDYTMNNGVKYLLRAQIVWAG